MIKDDVISNIYKFKSGSAGAGLEPGGLLELNAKRMSKKIYKEATLPKITGQNFSLNFH